MEYHFEWDPDKAESNRRKHRIGFDQAATVFSDPRALSLYDAEHSKSEDRWISLGLSSTGALVVVCHTFEWIDPSTAQIRIFSCRKATRREKRQYSEQP